MNAAIFRLHISATNVSQEINYAQQQPSAFQIHRKLLSRQTHIS